ncbi:hypothetical protein IQ06DRAFT_344992 [Phaeosphaeriaceae sp. SRC1lsM3a]|nr:hypothetical protein IQ06DRAFT_344992 [Stagonospora sp. SRC1lsM3a]
MGPKHPNDNPDDQAQPAGTSTRAASQTPWLFNGPFDPRNTDPRNPANMQDCGFEHLNLPLPKAAYYSDHPMPNTWSKKLGSIAAGRSQSIAMIVGKFKLVVKFIQADKELGLDPDRRLDKDPTDRVRDVMALGQQITDAGVAAFDEEEYVETVKTLEDDREFHWGEVRDILAFMMEG